MPFKPDSNNASETQFRNIRWHQQLVSRNERKSRNQHPSLLIWLTGLPGSGKSTLAHALERQLFDAGYQTYVLDGDNVRHGLCSDLGFSDEDRTENIRRIGELALLLLDAGIITLAAFVSPFKEDRRKVRNLVGDENFIEIYCHCPLEVCEARDEKGNYAKARVGIIPSFTGISGPYEPPELPNLVINTNISSVEASVQLILNKLHNHLNPNKE
jgi:adenylylsulfate kinase